MATDCPCGCGRKISRLGKRTTERAVFIASLSELPEHLAEVFADRRPADAEVMAALQREGEACSAFLLDYAHGQAPEGLSLPSAKDLGDWEASALSLVPLVQEVDPEWLSRWPGPVRNRVTGKGRG